MKIVIAGAGATGSHLVKLLSTENHEITVLDTNPLKVESLANHYDIMPAVGSATSMRDLLKASVDDADLFVAVTPFESENINACVFATNLGAKKTIARINNYEYMLEHNLQKFKEIGVSSLIYPESLAAQEIREASKSTWHRFKMSYSDNKLIIVGVKVRKNAAVINQEFKTGFLDHGKFRVVAIKRENETIIPKGNDMILPNDTVFFLTTEDNLDYTREQAGKKLIQVKNIMIMGGSRIGVKTAQFLPERIKAKIIESDRDRCYQISEKLPKTLIINGDGRDMDLLKEEGIKDTDAFIALTGHAETNILACLAAKRLGVPKTIAEIENIDYIPLAESLDIGTIINKKIITASHIYQLTLDESVLDIKYLPMSDAQIIEFEVKAGCKISKGKIRDMKIPSDVNFGGYIHKNEGHICSGNTELVPGDRVIVFCLASSLHKIEHLFS